METEGTSKGTRIPVTHLLELVDAATPSPTPVPIDPSLVTPGFGGFAVVALLAVAVVLIVWDMQRRIRRIRYREEVKEQLDAEFGAESGPESSER